MGQAKQRGTYDQRVAKAKSKFIEVSKQQAKAKAKAKQQDILAAPSDSRAQRIQKNLLVSMAIVLGLTSVADSNRTKNLLEDHD